MPSRAVDGVPPPRRAGRRWLLSPWLAVLLGLLCFASSLPNGFTYDDQPLVLNNPRTHSLTDFRRQWLADWWQALEDTQDFSPHRDRLYRPLTLVSFALNYAVHGTRPFGYHAANVALHAACCFLVWHLARRLLDDATGAALAAALFAVHPVHAEAVAGIVGRAEVLTTLFMLGGLLVLCPRDGPPRPWRIVWAAPLFLAALLAKETAVCYPAVAVLVYWSIARTRNSPAGAPRGEPRPPAASRRRMVVVAAALLAPLLIYFPLRYFALDHHLFRAEPVDNLMNPLVVAQPLQRAYGTLAILGQYAHVLLVPNRLSCDYGVAIIDPEHEPSLMALVGAITAIAILAGLHGWRRHAGVWPRVALLTTLIVASYALISNTVLLIGVTLAERLMYWPSVPVLILVALGLVEFWRRQCSAGQPLAARAGLLRGLGLLVLVALGLRTAVRNTDWQNNLTLFGTDVRTYPEGAHLNRCYGGQLLRDARPLTSSQARTDMLQAADHFLGVALEIRPAYPDALIERGEVRAQLGDLEQARLLFESALRLRPDSESARQALDKLRAGSQAGTDLTALRQRVESQPDDAAARIELGRALLAGGDIKAATEQIDRALELAPDDPDALLEHGKLLALREDQAGAIQAFEAVLRQRPDDWQAHANLTVLLAERDPQAALAHAQRAYELQPGDDRNIVNLAEAYVKNRQVSAALRLYRSLREQLRPNDPYRAVLEDRIKRLEQRPP